LSFIHRSCPFCLSPGWPWLAWRLVATCGRRDGLGSLFFWQPDFRSVGAEGSARQKAITLRSDSRSFSLFCFWSFPLPLIRFRPLLGTRHFTRPSFREFSPELFHQIRQ